MSYIQGVWDIAERWIFQKYLWFITEGNKTYI